MAQSDRYPKLQRIEQLAQASDTVSSEESDRPALRLGSSGPMVIELQVRLKKLGFFEADIDGDFNEVTATAVKTFQQEYELEADGIVAEATWKALEDPAAAKISAAIEASNPDASEDDVASDEADDASESGENPAADPSPFASSSKLRLAVLAVSILGLGVGGLGIGKMITSSKPSRNSKRSRKQHQASSLKVSTLATLPTPPQASPQPFFSDNGAVFADDDDSFTPSRPLAETNQERLDSQTGQSPQLSRLKEQKGPRKTRLTGALSPSQSSALAPPPPPSAIERSNQATELSPTPRLARLDIVESLIGQLQSHNPTQRRKAIWELGQRADSRAIQPLVNLMATSDSKQRSLILATLSEIGTQTLKPMKRALAMSLQDANAEVRKNAIRDLTRIYDLVAQISSLLAIATEDQDPEVRETARWALGQLNRIRANAGLEQAPTQQLLNKSVTPPETVSDELSQREQNISHADLV